jgi:hypothetical protein
LPSGIGPEGRGLFVFMDIGFIWLFQDGKQPVKLQSAK